MKNTDRSHSMPQQLNAYVFDAYGTLFDVHAAIERHRTSVGSDADRFSELWRTKQLEYTWTLTLAGRYADFWTLTQRALDFCFTRFPAVDRNLRGDLLNGYLELGAYPDAKDALRALKARGERTAVLSNGSPAMLASAVEAAGLKAELDAVLSVDVLKMFKPRMEVYALITKEFACTPAEVMFVSSNRWDAMGATAFGFRTVWINRAKNPDEYTDCPPAAVVSSLSEVPLVKC
jgi:2-haloacid dehalogenase